MRERWIALAALAAASLATPGSAAAALLPTAECDFDSDGFRDLVVAAPFATVQRSGVDHPGAGAVFVMYGTSTGPSSTRTQKWTQDSADDLDVIGDFTEDDDHFGAAVACGDFNDDGVGDLAIGVPGEDRNYFAGGPQHTDAGDVEVIFGTHGVGLTPKDDVTLTPTKNQDNAEDPSNAWDNAQFGFSLATLDMFNGTGGHAADGGADLAIGAPGFEGGNGLAAALTGKKLIASVTRPVFDLFDLSAEPGSEDRYGLALIGGDFDHDGIGDLVVGTPNHDVVSGSNTFSSAGRVEILYGNSPAGHLDIFIEGTGADPGLPASHDIFGLSLAAGDLNGDGIDDLVVGAPGRSVAGHSFAGQIETYHGSLSGHVVFDRIINEESAGIASDSTLVEFFGRSLAVANFGNGAGVDLAIGANGENVNGKTGGAVFALYNNGSDVVADGSKRLTQATSGVPDNPENGDGFGSSLVAGQFGRGAANDLVIGVPGEDLVQNSTTISNTGLVQLLFGSSTGLTSTNNRKYSLLTPSLGPAAGGEKFGSAVE